MFGGDGQVFIVGQLGYDRSAADCPVSIGGLPCANLGNLVKILQSIADGNCVVIIRIAGSNGMNWLRLFRVGLNLDKRDASFSFVVALVVSCIVIVTFVSGGRICSGLGILERCYIVIRWITATALLPPRHAVVDVAYSFPRRDAGSSSISFSLRFDLFIW